MTLVNYDPYSAFESPAGLRLFGDTLSRLLKTPDAVRPWVPNVDITETQDTLVLTADLPGVALNDIEILFDNGTLTVKGERKYEQADKAEGYHRRERVFGSFMRCFALPDTVDPEKLTASHENGVLTVTMSKNELAKPRSIKIEAKSN
ncbi:MAG: Hsp20/alpha crystallin family protein [Acidobacteria bacterium]|nr:Hsp20/alpha crystallin family protein [Acidobacteriota bacterium]